MSTHNEICDEEFVPFLHNLGVETYNKSFEWMLNDPDFSGVLRWLYHNLDNNNALTAREECRYAEIEKIGRLLPSEDLETAITSIQNELPGICLPGDKEAVVDVKLDISMQQEKLHMLEKHERAVKELVKQNELANEELSVELTKLNSAQKQYAEDVGSATEECLHLAEEVEAITDGVINVIADTLDVYGNCHVDKDITKKFLTFGPLESYRQSQALFRSHFDLFTSKRFGTVQNHGFTDDDLQAALVEAKSLEERLSNAIAAYIESKAELRGEQAKLSLVANYNNVHPSQIAVFAIEAQTALDLLVQEESILEQQLRAASQDLVLSRTRLAVDTTTGAALAVREQIHTDLSHLLDTTQQALALDRVLYCALRHELRAAEQCLQFAAQLRQYAAAEDDAVRSRIDSMNEISAEIEACDKMLESSDPLLQKLFTILGAPASNDALMLTKLYNDLQKDIAELYSDIIETYRKKEDLIVAITKSSQPLRKLVWDGCTRQPRSRPRAVAALAHALRHETAAVEARVLDVGGLFTTVKNGDKHNLRKLWQWFLTDQPRFLAAVKGVQGTSS